MLPASRKAVPPCCAAWTSSCCRAFSGSSTSQAAAQTKQRPQSSTAYIRQDSVQGRPNFQRDPPILYPRLPTINKPNNYQRPPSVDRSGSNGLGIPDRGWGPRQPLPTGHSQVDQGSTSVRGGGNPWDLTGRGSLNRTAPQRPGPSNVPLKRPSPQFGSTPTREHEQGDAAEYMSAHVSFRDRDIAPPPQDGRLSVHSEKERRRKEHEYNEGLKFGKERQLQRQKTAQQVVKGVAKLAQIRKARDIFLSKHVSVQHLARLLGVKMERLQVALKRAGMTDISYDHLLDSEDAALIAPEFGCNAILDEVAAFDIYPPPLPADMTSLPHRPPVVTIMGHVDHGKTTLLDKLRSASVAQGEAGGITQHIGAFSLPVSSLSTSKTTDNKDGRIITFLDTPGHAAFSAMRARGAMVTDVIVLVVAADDGVMPQTKEVIELAKKDQGHVNLVVAINKIDKPGADADTVKQMLLAEGVQLEEFGGDVPAVEVSGMTGQGLDNLMETVSLVAELKDIRAERHGTAVGYVLESNTVKGVGPVATVLLHRGELTTGAHLIAGEVQCRVRSLTDSAGKSTKSAAPGTAVLVSGWKELPAAGDQVIQAAEDEVKRAVINRKRNHALTNLIEDVGAINEKRRLERERREEELGAAKEALTKGQALPPKPLMRSDVEHQDDGVKYLHLIIKADVSGSAEAVAGALEGIGNDKAKTKMISYQVGNVTEGDITMAKATEASIVAFGVNAPRSIAQMALSQDVPIISSNIIYRVMETIREKVAELLPPIIEFKVVGEANVQASFNIDLKGRKTLKVAGCRVTNGTLEKNKSVRLIRNGVILYDGPLDTLRHLKKEVTEARKGMECGLSLSGYSDDFLPGDIIQIVGYKHSHAKTISELSPDHMMMSGRLNRIMMLPTDLWFEVIDYLRVTDIVHFRAVSRNFYRIVSSPVVWKRLLRKIGAPLPFQATSIASLSSKETEKLIKRALCLDINWRRVSPMAHPETLRSVERPYMVRILPGGKWLVAATQSSDDQSAAVVVWDLENPEERGGSCMLLAKCRTRTRVSQMVVRYMVYKGKQGIAIATLRAIGDKPATKTEVCVIHISLEALEKLSTNQNPGGPPFNLVELHKTRCQVAFLNLEGMLLSVVHRPRTLMFLDLETKQSSQIKLSYSTEGQRHSIQGSKILPLQNQVLVVRLIYSDDRTSYAFELYELPPWDTVAKEPAPLSHHVFDEAAPSSFVISDNMAQQPNSDRPTAKEKAQNNHFLAPISIFAHTLRPKGIIHWQIEAVPMAANPASRRLVHGYNAIFPNVIGQNPSFPTPPPNPEAPAPFPNPIVNPLSFPFFGGGPILHMAGFPTHLLNPPSLARDLVDTDSPIAEDAFDAVPPRPQYVLPAKRMAHYWFEDNDQKPTVLPGADRSVFWTRPMETRADYPPMRNLLAYTTTAPLPYNTAFPHFPAMATNGYDVRGDTEMWGFHPGAPSSAITVADGASLPDKRLKHLRLTQEFIDAVQAGTQNAAFDEGSGKLCLAAGKPTDLYLLDYAMI